MISGLLTGVLSGFVLSTQLDLSNIEAFQRGIRTGFKESLLVGWGSTLGDAIYWVIMLMGHHKIIESLQSNRFYIIVYAFFLLLLGLFSILDLRRFNENKISSPNKIMVFIMKPFVAGFVMSVLTPSTMVWSFLVLEIFEQRLIPQETAMAMEPQMLAGLIIGGIVWAFFLALLATKSKVFFRDWFLKLFLVINSILFFLSSLSVFAKAL